MTKIYTAILIAGLMLTACDRPSHRVIEGNQPMVVYSARTASPIWSEQCKWEYWITDATGQGWLYATNTELSVGDTVTVCIK